MNTKGKPPILAACALTLSLLACNFGAPAPRVTPSAEAAAQETEPATQVPATEAPTGVPAQAASACDNPYLPVVEGAWWQYKLTGPVPDTYTHTILSVESDGFSEQDVFGVGVTRQGNWKCADGGLVALNPPTGSSGTVESQNVQVDLQTKNVTGVTLPASMQAGDAWSQTLELEGTETLGGVTFPASNNITYNCKAIGVEAVTVEAGSFDALRVECTTVNQISIEMPASPVNTTVTITGTSWYAQNVGMLKNVTSGMGFDSSIELLAYTIPQ